MNRNFFAFLLIATFALGCAAGEDSDAGYAARMAEEHAGDAPVAGAAAGDAAAEVTAEDVSYWPGTDVRGYLARPAGAPRGGILVIQEWWGLNDNIRTMARRLADEGYLALAVDLYEGGVATTPEEARALMSAAMEDADRVRENLRAAHAYLASAGAAGIGTIGWCFGGGWSLNSAIMLGERAGRGGHLLRPRRDRRHAGVGRSSGARPLR